MRILFVDDHPHFSRIVTGQFLADHEVVLVGSLAEAREELSRGRFDTVLLDYDLPDGKGDTLVRELREGGFAGALIGVSARESGQEALQRAGAHALCPKSRFHTIGEFLAPTQGPTLPDLDPPYDRALKEAVDYAVGRFDPVGLVAAGSVVRGRPGPSSDLDLVCLHGGSVRQQVHRRFSGVPADLFAEPLDTAMAVMHEQAAARRPVLAHMLATGAVILARDATTESLRAEARRLMEHPPPPQPGEGDRARHEAVTLLEDALDSADPATASLLLGRAVDAMLEVPFRARGRYLPQPRDLLRALERGTADAASAFHLAATPEARRRAALDLAERVLGTACFMEWESSPDSRA